MRLEAQAKATEPPPFPELEGVRFKSPRDYQAYAFSTDGHAWSCNAGGGRFRGSWKKMKPAIDKDGYCFVNLYNANGMKRHRVATQVLTLFVSRRPFDMECRHLNGVPADNRLENLKWGTAAENAQDRVLHGTCPLLKRGLEHPATKISDAQVQEIIMRRKRGEARASLAAEFGVTHNHITTLVRCGGRNPLRKKKKVEAPSPWLA